VQNIDQRALADLEAEQIAQHVGQSRQRDVLDRAQIDRQGAKVRPERRARLQSFGRLGLEAPGATRADPAIQRDLGHVGFDPGDFDAVVGLARALRDLGHIRAAPSAATREDRMTPRRMRMKRAMRPGVRFRLRLGFRRFRGLLSLRGRQARIVRGLGRLIELGLEFRDPSRQPSVGRRQRLDLGDQRGDDRVLVDKIGRGSHPNVDSDSRPRLNKKIASRRPPGARQKPGGEQLRGSAPSQYLLALQNHKQVGLDDAGMDALLRSHQVDPEALRKDDFDAFYVERGRALCKIIEGAMGKTIDTKDVSFRL